MKEPVLVIIKPDGTSKKLIGKVLAKLDEAKLEIVAARTVKATRAIAQEHYKQIKGKLFFEEVVQYLCGKFHKDKKLLALIYYGENAIKKCRHIAGATSPKDASRQSIRGAYGRITAAGLFENVVHVSSDKKEAEREIKLWFNPGDVVTNLYPTKIKTIKTRKKKVWK